MAAVQSVVSTPAHCKVVMPREKWVPLLEQDRSRAVALLGENACNLRDRDNPVYNFFSSYYGRFFKPSTLLRDWSPGINKILVGVSSKEDGFGRCQGWAQTEEGGIYIDPDLKRLSKNRLVGMRWIRRFLEISSAKPPRLNCYGLHEWAMLYAPESSTRSTGIAKHQNLPLRVPQRVINEVVEQGPLRCTYVKNAWTTQHHSILGLRLLQLISLIHQAL